MILTCGRVERYGRCPRENMRGKQTLETFEISVVIYREGFPPREALPRTLDLDCQANLHACLVWSESVKTP